MKEDVIDMRSTERNPAITVITLTHNRVALLMQAIESVRRQTYSGPLNHLVLIDNCETTQAALEGATALPQGLNWIACSDEGADRPIPARVAGLRNRGVALADTPLVAFLDDDNEWEPDHLATLAACHQSTGCPAVHSYLRLFWPDGRPYVEARLPWARDDQEGHTGWRRMVRLGVFKPGSNIVRDRVDPLGTPDPVRSVDMGAWLFERELLLNHPFPMEYDEADWAQVTTEDDKLLDILVRERVPIAASGHATLRYRLGGYSNNRASNLAGTW